MRRTVVVHPPSPTGGRRVTIGGEILGLAYNLADVEEFLRRAGVDDPDVLLATAQGAIEWHGGSPEEWT
ncbi:MULTISPECIES: hypothetical protein [Streptomyces]|uniref:Uncharacterized protein n=1 Tax=Streptomyces ramulosus TaxID=47762 RepID=A0ABW1FTB4_9ACTN